LSLLTRKDVLAFLLICFLAQFSHGPYYTFYTIYLTQHGYEAGLIGQLWALGVIAEVVIFLFIHRWLPSYGVRAVLAWSLILTVLRWLLIGLFPEHFAVIIFAQLLHAASYGTFHACAIAWVHQHFTGRNQGRGQALYSSISFGAGGAVGSLASGYLWDHSAELTFVIAALSAAIATVTTWFYLKNPSTTSQLSTSPSK
jgi:PPP family 3-phenylpropionic acid transporter